jgi:hypothetical protein
MHKAVRDGGILLLPLKMLAFGAEQQPQSLSTDARARTHTHTHTHTHTPTSGFCSSKSYSLKRHTRTQATGATTTKGATTSSLSLFLLLSIYLSIYPFIYPSTHVLSLSHLFPSNFGSGSPYLSFSLSIYRLSIYLSRSIYIYITFYLSIYLSSISISPPLPSCSGSTSLHVSL